MRCGLTGRNSGLSYSESEDCPFAATALRSQIHSPDTEGIIMAEVFSPLARDFGDRLEDKFEDKRQTLALDETALQRARGDIDEGAVTPSYGPYRDSIVKLLNDALATELV